MRERKKRKEPRKGDDFKFDLKVAKQGELKENFGEPLIPSRVVGDEKSNSFGQSFTKKERTVQKGTLIGDQEESKTEVPNQ